MLVEDPAHRHFHPSETPLHLHDFMAGVRPTEEFEPFGSLRRWVLGFGSGQ